MDTTPERIPPSAIPAVELATCDPHQLELSPLSEAGQPDESLPYLTEYCRRAHDRRLVSAVEAAAAGRSGIVTLVGGPATGKKRALWEAATVKDADGHLLLYGWTIWPGLSPRSPEELLASAKNFRRNTVVWIPSAERYLSPDSNGIGNEVAECLRNLLHDTERAPVLILASLTPERWQDLTAPPAGGVDRSHVHLLLRGTSLPVPGSFSDTEVSRALASLDPRVSDAAANAPNGQVIQTVVAVPALRAHCQRISPFARAMLDFVIEARHAGHEGAFPRTLLHQGAQAFLDGSPPDTDAWFDKALKELATPVRGGAAVLVKQEDSYRLAPCLDRHYVTEAANPLLPRASLWPVLLDSVAGQDSLAIARECERRHLLELSARFFGRAAEHGIPRARAELAAMLAKAGRIDEAVAQYRMITRTGEGDVEEAIDHGAAILFAAEREKDVLDWLGPLAETGSRSAALHVAAAHTRRWRPDLALAAHRRRAERGDLQSAAYVAANMVPPEILVGSWQELPGQELEHQRIRRRKELDKAVRWLTRLAGQIGRDLLPLITDLVLDAFGIDEALKMLYKEATDYDRYDAYLLGAKALSAAGQVQKALNWVEKARQHNVSGTPAVATRVNLRARLLDAAGKSALEAAAAGDAAPLIEVGDAFAESGIPDKAIECYDAAARTATAAFAAAALGTARCGLLDETRGYYRRAALAGCAPDPAEIVRLLRAAGKVAEALEWYVATVAPVPGALAPIARYLTDFGQAKMVAEAVRARENIPRWQALAWVADELLGARSGGTDRATVSGNGPHLGASAPLVLAGRLYKEAAGSGAVRVEERAVRLLMDARNFVEAVQLIRSGRETVPRRLRALLAEALAGRGTLKEAEQILDELVDEDDFSAAAGVARGFNLHEEYFKAQDIAERGVKGGDVECCVLLGDLRRGAGDQTRVLDLYCRALAHGHPGARVRIDRVLTADSTAWEHAQLRKHGLDPRGQIAPDWEVPGPGAEGGQA
ncbi:tetratricopeptide repeat protein [Amycolatopsis sp. WGS_07]|uniref:tetratricopeptide repeat protein n=1 Tax=Amycolatopsis sp. WGS_07 TaxID=3076764 RepID=UPI0038734F6D